LQELLDLDEVEDRFAEELARGRDLVGVAVLGG